MIFASCLALYLIGGMLCLVLTPTPEIVKRMGWPAQALVLSGFVLVWLPAVGWELWKGKP